MEISFVRTQGSPDRVYARRTGGGQVSWAFPSYGGQVPHDLVHLLVETAFGLKNGFWGRVDAGVDVARLNADANRKGGPGKYAGFGPDQAELYIAEFLAGTRWRDAELTNVQLAAALARMLPRLAPVSTDRILSIRSTLDRLCARWAALVPKGTLEARFDPADLEKSFSELGRVED
jgi:hypothetical protein